MPSEPLPGQKTTLVATIFTVLNALAMGGLLPPEVAENAPPVATGLFSVTLILKALRRFRFGKS